MSDAMIELLLRAVMALEQIAENTKPGEDEKKEKQVKGFGL